MEATTPAPASSARSARGPRDLVFAMVVLLVPVFGLLGLYRLLGNEDPPVYDAASAYDAARSARTFEVLEPSGLPKGYYVQSATFRLGVLRIGMQTPDEGGLQIMQTDQPADRFVPAQLGSGARPSTGEVEVNGRRWQRYAGGREGERALILLEPTRTVIVLGRAKEDQLRRVVEALT